MRHLFFTTLWLAAMGANAQTNFIYEDWNAAMEEAKESGKPVFVDFYTDWCVWCKVMDTATFAKETTSQKMNAEFVNLKIDAEKGMGVELAFKYRIRSYPAYGFFSPEGELIMKSGGFVKEEPWGEILDEALSKNSNGEVLEGVSSKLNAEYPDFLEAYFKEGRDQYPKVDDVEKYIDESEDLKSELSFSLLFMVGVPEKHADKVKSHLTEYRKLFGDSDVDRLVNNLAVPMLQKAQEEKSETVLEECITFLKANYSEFGEASELSIRTRFYQGTEDWKNVGALVDKRIKAGYMNPGQVNSISWAIYEKCDDPKTISKAAEWMAEAVEEEPNYFLMDTYGALLFKGGELTKAKEVMTKALELGEASGQDVQGTKEVLSLIEQELSKK